MIKRNRVVVTGIGVLAPNGTGLTAFWESLCQGRSGVGPITLFDASAFRSRIAGEVKGFDPVDYIDPEMKPRRMARHTQLAYAATMMALKDADLNLENLELPSPTPVVIGVSTSALDVIERVFHDVTERSPDRVSPTALGASKPQAAANLIADKLGSCANAATISSACPSGLDAIAIAAEMIRSGEAEIAIAGGADAPITPLAMASFTATGLSSLRNAEPEKASRPFDLTRDSGVISEGAGVFVIENLERAEARGARVYLEISGYASQRDFDPAQPASGLEHSMQLALANASRCPGHVDYISAYGPGHPFLDAMETKIIKRVFGKHAWSIPVSSIKGVTGNPLAAGGPFQLIACALTMRDNLISPTANYETADPACDLDIVPNHARRGVVDCALINVRGLGGSASTLVVERVRPE
ncbi:MAG: beta-ketoacyl-[acyl-carrier-protein] synthase family protein [Chthoniobacterales bacterium]|nr:beta-ketoacyl-[acyl-carrier-protein] synthase family protein [Chthoniobacterales bacterium]